MIFYRGDTFLFAGPAVAKVNGVDTTDLTGWSARSQIRTDKGVLVAELVVTWLSFSPAAIQLESSETTVDWPIGDAKIDVEFTDPSNRIISTPPVAFKIGNDVTRGTPPGDV